MLYVRQWQLVCADEWAVCACGCVLPAADVVEHERWCVGYLVVALARI